MSEMKDSQSRRVSTDTDPRCPPQDLLSLYAHGALSEDEATGVKNHVETCSSCGGYVRQIEIVLSMTEAPERIDPGERFNEIMWRRIRVKRTKRKARLALYPTLAAAAIALVFILPLSRNGVSVTDQELVEQLDLFQHIELMENLDLVESIDLIMSEEGVEEES